ncbi:AraC family transcriptional regulator [Mucilaginibacter sp. S1162]|uniref:AraC family transcriptional regulator n=1 Tax=Mucilaginibacter humi TaxID=2732510 RepID=A0ABX1VZX4_9SPHI|nr:AraC family transcriptional regulator [Mucilaginibacter humi]NNU33504.1 AraC family transcriptional regulator [Mucilaginibacter humi]
MKAIEQRLPQDFDKSFVVFRETGKYFPCPRHFHPEFELVLILKSTGRRMVGDHIGYFDEDDLVFMGSGIPHVWINDAQFMNGEAGYPADAIVIHFMDSFLGDKFLSIPEMENFKNILRTSSRGLAYHGETRTRINNLMKSMLTMSGLKRLSALFEIFDILATSAEYEVLASPGYTQVELKASDRFGKVTEYIMRNFDKEITLPEVASIANMAVTTFCNFFKDHFRVTFVEYLNTVRIGYACKLLADDDHNIVEIAYESGFKNLANFNRQFKRFKNMTPTEYRKTIGA